MDLTNYLPRTAEDDVGVLFGPLPGFERAAAERILETLRSEGFAVKAVQLEDFRAAQGDAGCAVLVIPDAAAFPADCGAFLKAYAERGGQLLVLGGPLFARLVKQVDGGYRDIPYDPNAFDATFAGEMPQFVLEGLAPSYKTHLVQGITEFAAESGQVLFTGGLSGTGALDVVCPFARPHGQGFGQKRRTRFIPLVECMGDGGRADGRRGAAAWFMLSDTAHSAFGHAATRPGGVSSAIIGSASAGIGIVQQDILAVPGMRGLLASLVRAQLRGLFLFEGGSSAFVVDRGAAIVLGARVMNLRQDWRQATLRFRITDAGRVVVETSLDVQAAPRCISEFSLPCPSGLDAAECVTVEAELVLDGAVVDRIDHELRIRRPRQPQADGFATVRDGAFIVDGKPWNAVGINYWPSFFAGVEEVENWYGWLSDAYYDQVETERDLAFMAACGFNFLMTRLDGDILGRSLPQLLDFLARCRRHGIRVSLAWPEVMSPFHFNEPVLEAFFNATDIQDDPTVLCYDIIWELGNQALCRPGYWDEPWRRWLEERYGSPEQAERDWGFPAPRSPDGRILMPTREHYWKDGPWRVMAAAARRFMNDLLSAKLGSAARRLRRMAPRQLLTYRLGVLDPQDIAYTQASGRHMDFLAPEGYSFPLGEHGFNATCFASRYLAHAGNGKPVVWSEFGLSSVGMRGGAQFWDRRTMNPPEAKLQEQDAYMQQFYKAILDTGCNGSAPWWWSGGVRRRELSDFGFLAPDGTLRPFAANVRRLIPQLLKPGPRRASAVQFIMDVDASADGHSGVCFGPGARAYATAAQEGRALEVVTAGTGTDSANAPRLAVGNVPLSGSNPPKFLNAEFDSAILEDDRGHTWVASGGAEVAVPAGARLRLKVVLGNLQEATWLQPRPGLPVGSVWLVSCSDSDIRVKVPLPCDVRRFEAVSLCVDLGTIPTRTSLTLQMTAESISTFGQKLSLTIAPSC